MNEKILFDNFLNKNKQYDFFYEKINNYNIKFYSTNIIKTIENTINADKLKALYNEKIYGKPTTYQMIIDWKNFKLFNDKIFKRFLRFIKENNAYNDLVRYSNKKLITYICVNSNRNFILKMVDNVIEHFLCTNNEKKENNWNQLKNKWYIISRKLKYDYKT